MKNPKLPSERSFGLLFLSVAAGLGLFGLYREWAAYVVVAFFLACLALGLATVFFPHVLAPLNKAWFHFGRMLAKIVNPIVLGILFYGLLAPVALISRMLGRDELKLKRRQAQSYWVDRDPPGPGADSFKNQF